MIKAATNLIPKVGRLSKYSTMESSVSARVNPIVIAKKVNRLKFQICIFVPISFVLGMLAGLTENGDDLENLTRWDGLLLAIGILVPVLYGTLWFL